MDEAENLVDLGGSLGDFADFAGDLPINIKVLKCTVITHGW